MERALLRPRLSSRHKKTTASGHQSATATASFLVFFLVLASYLFSFEVEGCYRRREMKNKNFANMFFKNFFSSSHRRQSADKRGSKGTQKYILHNCHLDNDEAIFPVNLLLLQTRWTRRRRTWEGRATSGPASSPSPPPPPSSSSSSSSRGTITARGGGVDSD